MMLAVPVAPISGLVETSCKLSDFGAGPFRGDLLQACASGFDLFIRKAPAAGRDLVARSKELVVFLELQRPHKQI